MHKADLNAYTWFSSKSINHFLSSFNAYTGRHNSILSDDVQLAKLGKPKRLKVVTIDCKWPNELALFFGRMKNLSIKVSLRRFKLKFITILFAKSSTLSWFFEFLLVKQQSPARSFIVVRNKIFPSFRLAASCLRDHDRLRSITHTNLTLPPYPTTLVNKYSLHSSQ